MESLGEMRGVRLEIDLDNLAHNIREIKKYVGKDTKVMAIVKANAYGHGAVNVSKTFLENGADKLAVSIVSEGIELRKAGLKAPILILNYTSPDQFHNIIKYRLTQNIFDYRDAKLLSEKAVELGKEAKVHIKIDTGMRRIGLPPTEETIKKIIKINNLPNIKIEGIFSHFAKSDEEDKSFTDLQYRRFNWVINQLEEEKVFIPIKHISNSAAIIDMPEYNLDMVRPGIILYGHYPSEVVNKKRINIKPVLTLKSSISNIKRVPKGVGISYNQIYVTERDSIIATLPIGYADGYSRLLTGKGQVYIKNKRAPIIGKICMDQMMVDITDIKGVNMDDEVILFGYGNDTYPTIEELAKNIGTVNYEIMCMISRRIPRIYIKDNKTSTIVDYILD